MEEEMSSKDLITTLEANKIITKINYRKVDSCYNCKYFDTWYDGPSEYGDACNLYKIKTYDIHNSICNDWTCWGPHMGTKIITSVTKCDKCRGLGKIRIGPLDEYHYIICDKCKGESK